MSINAATGSLANNTGNKENHDHDGPDHDVDDDDEFFDAEDASIGGHTATNDTDVLDHNTIN